MFQGRDAKCYKFVNVLGKPKSREKMNITTDRVCNCYDDR